MGIVNQQFGPGFQCSWGSNKYVTLANITQRHDRRFLLGLIVCAKPAVKAQVSLTDMRTVGHSAVFGQPFVKRFALLSVLSCL